MRTLCQTDYSIHSKLRIFPLLCSCNIQANKGLTKVQEKWSTIQFDVFDLSFIFFVPMSQKVSVINRSGACYLIHASN